MSDKTQQGKLTGTFGVRMAIIIVMSSIIGSGVFKKVAPMSELLHMPWLVILAWVLAGLIVLFGVFCIAELSSMFPDSGGPFIWLEKIYGKLVSFLYGWASFTVIQTAAISSVAFVFAGALNTFIELPRLPESYESIRILGIPFLDNIGAKLISCALIVGLTFINIKDTKKGGNLSLLFTLLIVICIFAVIIGAFASPVGSMETFNAVSSAYPEEKIGILAFISAMVLAMRAAFWGYEGWIALGFIGEEIKDSDKNLPKALVIGITLVILIYLLINTAYLYVMPIDEMMAAINLDQNNIAAVLVIDKILGSGGAYVISGMILISTFGCTNATILLSARIYYAMARKGLFFKNAALTYSKNNTPKNALIYQGVWACLLVFSGSFDLLTDLVVIAGFSFYGLIVFGVIWLRIKMKDTPRKFKTPLYPLVPAIFVLFCIILILVSFIENPTKSLIGMGLIFSGLPFYYYWNKKNHSQKVEKV